MADPRRAPYIHSTCVALADRVHSTIHMSVMWPIHFHSKSMVLLLHISHGGFMAHQWNTHGRHSTYRARIWRCRSASVAYPHIRRTFVAHPSFTHGPPKAHPWHIHGTPVPYHDDAPVAQPSNAHGMARPMAYRGHMQ